MRTACFTACLCLLADPAHAVESTVLACAHRGPASVHVSGAPAPATLRVRTDARAWLELDEDGRALTMDGVAVASEISSPPRLARRGAWVSPDTGAIGVHDSALADAPVSFRARLFCDDATARAQATQVLADVSADTKPPLAADRLEAALRILAEAAATTRDADLRALAVHLSAQARLAAALSLDAATAFGRAEQAWVAVADRARALAARTARVEELYGLGRFDAVIDDTASLPEASDGAPGYYAARLQNARCVALKYRGRREDSDACYATLVERLVHLAEPLDLANALLNRGALQLELQQLAAADASVVAAERLLATDEMTRMPAVDVAMIRGRTRLLRGDVAVLEGDAAAGIASYDHALAEFATAKAPRWQSSVLLQMARLFGNLGAYGDAYATWGQATGLLRPSEAPARMASALLTLARIEAADRHPRLAAWFAGQARARSADLGLPSERQEAQIVRLHALLEDGRVADAAQELAGSPQDIPRLAGAWALVRAAVAVAQGSRKLAEQELVGIDAASLSLAEQDKLDTLLATVRAPEGGADAAVQPLERAIERARVAMQTTTNALLRTLLQRRDESLRRLAIAIRLEGELADADAPALVKWLPQLPAPVRAEGPAARASSPFDEALARELLVGTVGDAGSATRALPALLGVRSPSAEPAAGDGVEAGALQAQLGEDDAVLVLIDGRERGAAIWITRHAVRVTRTAPLAAIRERAYTLSGDLQTWVTPIGDIQRDARELAAALWPAHDEPGALRKLYVVADDTSSTIDWTLLPGPAGIPLLETTDVSLIHLARAAGNAASPLPLRESLTVAIAPQSSASSGVLEPLANAASEPALIAASMPGLRVDTLDAARMPVKEPLLAALATAGSWVHVAAHGVTQPGYLGRSGLWLDPPAPGRLPQFVSSLDLYVNGARADLVVLDACRLGDSGADAPATIAFAETLVRQGAQNVVAARWPVSDGAASIWVPKFYSVIASQATPDSAAALRQAQLRLAQSSMYRHPFFWASLVHMGRFNLPAAANRSAARQSGVMP